MSILDKNKIFFGLIHYVFSEQDNVDWAFKTSLVNFTGINATIENKKYKQESPTESVIQYINSVKPYHIQFEQFIEKYSSQQDEVYVSSTEQNNITYYIRHDAITSEITPQGEMSDLDYMDTHMANRLYYYKTKDMSMIKDYLNCHFKGLTVDAGTLNMDKFGYDAFLYDTKMYDAPTITNEYCLVSFSELIKHAYEKKFIAVGASSYAIPSDITLSKEDMTVTSYYDGKIEEITNYSLESNIVTLFYSSRKFEKIEIKVEYNDYIKSFVYVSHPFIECNDPSSVRKFVSVDERVFELPNNLNSGKVTVHIENMNGSRLSVPTNGYEVRGNMIEIYDPNLSENWKVLITVVDYDYIYDKIYNWEDLYGLANNMTPYSLYYENYDNIQNLDGNDMLRPHYEAERPSELCVGHPLTYLMVYNQNNNGNNTSVYNIDYKNNQYNIGISLKTKLYKDFNIGDSEIWIENGKKVKLPYMSNDELKPGRIMINSELINFYDYENMPDGSAKLKRISRAVNGSYLCQKHLKGDIVYDMNPMNEKKYKINNLSSSYIVSKNTENKFIIPGEFSNNDKIEVWKKPTIKLLSDITYKSTYFDISSNDVKLPTNVLLNTVVNDNIIVYENQVLTIQIGSKVYDIEFTKRFTKYKELVDYLNSQFRDKDMSITAKNINNEYITFVVPNGRSIRLYNKSGYALHDLYNLKIKASNEDVEIIKDGFNGLRINGYDVYWGTDETSANVMRKYTDTNPPKRGTLVDVVNTINKSLLVSDIVKAEIRDNKLHLIPLTLEKITYENISNTKDEKYFMDNMEMLGLPINTYANYDAVMYNGLLCFQNDVPEEQGWLIINNDKMYFSNIEITDKETYRIIGYNLDKEYYADNSIILAKTPHQIEKSKYEIYTEDYVDEVVSEDGVVSQFNKKKNYIVLNSNPSEQEIITVINRN